MTRAGLLAFATLACSAPGPAEPAASMTSVQSLSPLVGEPPAGVDRRGISFPVIEYRNADGVLRQRRGIIASKQVAPDTVVGLGLFETAPKARGYVGEIPNAAPKRTRRAAVGLSWKF